MIGHRIRHDLHRRRGVVSHVDELSLRLRRVTVALDPDAAPVPLVPLAVGDHVKLAFPHPETGELADPPVLRDYTIRAVPDERHVVVDVVLHGTGPGSTWAAAATDGTPVGVFGPRGSHVMPADRNRYIVLVDESAYPVAARWLEEAPDTARVEVAIETPDGTVAELPARPSGRVTVLAGADGSGLVAHLEGLRPAMGDLVWAAGEASAMLAVRKAAQALGVAKDDLEVHGYWKHGIAGRDHHAPLED